MENKRSEFKNSFPVGTRSIDSESNIAPAVDFYILGSGSDLLGVDSEAAYLHVVYSAAVCLYIQGRITVPFAVNHIYVVQAYVLHCHGRSAVLPYGDVTSALVYIIERQAGRGHI